MQNTMPRNNKGMERAGCVAFVGLRTTVSGEDFLGDISEILGG